MSENNGKQTTDVAVNPREAAKLALARATKPGTLAGLKAPDLRIVLQTQFSNVSAALPKHITPERMIQMYATLLTQNPKIAECSAESIIGALMQASILGFHPVQALGECYFVPYFNSKTGKSELQFQIGYKGVLALARRSNEIKMVYAEVVYKGDRFHYEYGLNESLTHEPNENSDKKDSDITHVYAVVHFVNGGYAFVVLTTKDVEKLRMRNASQKEAATGAWKTDKPAMFRAKAIKQLAKYLPLTTEAATAIVGDERALKPEMFRNDGGGLAPEELGPYDATYTEADNGKNEMKEAADEPNAEQDGVREEDIQTMQEQIGECKTTEEVDRLQEETAAALVDALGSAFDDRRDAITKGARKPTGSLMGGKKGANA